MGRDDVSSHRERDTRYYEGKHEKPGCLGLLIGLAALIAAVAAALLR